MHPMSRKRQQTKNVIRWRLRYYVQGHGLDHMTGKCFASRNKLQQEY